MKVAELSSTVAQDAIDPSTDQQPQCGLSVQQSEPETAFLPETLDPDFVAKQHALGKGDVVEKVRLKWEEIKAVRERYPVSRGMLQRIAHETMQTMLLPSTSTRDKLIATKLLLTMAGGNIPNKGLPEQIETPANDRFDMRRIIDAVLSDETPDSRENKIIPGSADDYAE